MAELQWRFVPSAASAPITESWHCTPSGLVTESESGEADPRLLPVRGTSRVEKGMV